MCTATPLHGRSRSCLQKKSARLNYNTMRLAFLIAACVISAYAADHSAKKPQHPPGVPQPTHAPSHHAHKAPLLDGGGKIIPDEYIIVFKEETDEGIGELFFVSLMYSYNTIHYDHHQNLVIKQNLRVSSQKNVQKAAKFA